MIGGVTRRELPYLLGVPHLHVNRPQTSWVFFTILAGVAILVACLSSLLL